MNRIHIIGSGPRTGTTLLTELFKVCFNIDSACEHEASICVSNTKLGGGNIVLSKYPVEIDVVQRPILLNKNLYVVCLIRDPRDMVVSYHGAYPDVYWCSMKFWSFFMKYYARMKHHPRFIIVKYEDLVSRPDEIQQYLNKRMPFLRPIHPFSQYHEYAQPDQASMLALKKKRPIEAKGVGNWLNNLERISQQLALHGDFSDSLIEFGYEENKDWLETLKQVEPSDFDTKTGEFFSDSELSGRKTREMIALFNILLEKLKLNPEVVLSIPKKLYKTVTKNAPARE